MASRSSIPLSTLRSPPHPPNANPSNQQATRPVQPAMTLGQQQQQQQQQQANLTPLEQEQTNLINKLWDFNLNGTQPNDAIAAQDICADLRLYFEAHQLTKPLFQQTATQPPPNERIGVEYCVRLLKVFPDETRSMLVDMINARVSTTLANPNNPQLGSVGNATSPPVAPPMTPAEANELTPQNVDEALVTAVGLLYSIRLLYRSTRTGGGQTLHNIPVYLSLWPKEQSLTALLTSFLPSVSDSSKEPSTTLRATQLAMAYFTKYASIDISWTDHLPNHLRLVIGAKTKTLFVYRYPSFLKVTYEATKNESLPAARRYKGGCPVDHFDVKFDQSLRKGRYTPEFLYETLMTYRLLLPIRNREENERLLKLAPHKLWALLRLPFTPDANHVDGNLMVPYEEWHFPSKYERAMTNRRELFERFPHWAVRLHTLYEETQDPTPMSKFENWLERRKSPRHSFKVTFFGFLLAIAFGVAATFLAAWQLALAIQDAGKEEKTSILNMSISDRSVL